jgi:proline racemase
MRRSALTSVSDPVHPEDERIRGVHHVIWCDGPRSKEADGRCAVFYGDKAIDRSLGGTGTSARMAQLFGKRRLRIGEKFRAESIIGTIFEGRVAGSAKVGNHDAIVPSIGGWARIIGHNTIFVDDRDPLAHGFQIA